MARNLLQRGAAWLARQGARHAALTVVYKRGAASISVRAVRGATMAEGRPINGVPAVQIGHAVWMIRAAELVFDGTQVDPQPGDLIIDGGRKFQVLPTSAEPSWRWCDASRLVRRIHTKDVGAA